MLDLEDDEVLSFFIEGRLDGSQGLVERIRKSQGLAEGYDRHLPLTLY